MSTSALQNNEEYRSGLLKELYYLCTDPLLESISDEKQDDDTEDAKLINENISGLNAFLEENEVGRKRQLMLLDLPGCTGKRSLQGALISLVSSGIYKPKEIKIEQESRKRRAESFADEQVAKARKSEPAEAKNDLTTRSVPVKDNTLDSSLLAPEPHTDKFDFEKETNKLLHEDFRKLDIIAIPEHYPTRPHSVSPLAELYYLTQTLPLSKLLPGSHKILVTENFEMALLEGKIAVLYSRIEELKRQGKWSLRQPIKFEDPFLYHRSERKRNLKFDNLLHEAKWMAVDFKESTKFKKTCCIIIAQAISDYWNYGKIMCIKRKPIRFLPDEEEIEQPEADQPPKNASAEKEDSIANETIDEIPINDPRNDKKEQDNDEMQVSQVPAEEDHSNILDMEEHNESTEHGESFSIDVDKLLRGDNKEDVSNYQLSSVGSSKVNDDNGTKFPFKVHVDLSDLKKIDQSIIKNLPKFTAFDEEPSMSAPILNPTDISLTPIGRFLLPFDEDDEWYKIVLKEGELRSKDLQPDGLPETQKTLFGVQSQRRFNYLKPPKPPLIKNIQYRSPTIWLPQDDKYLIHYVAEFCFNWDLISEHLLSSASTLKKYESNIERRTPWQCFERYIQLNEKFQFSDMKGIYSYHAQEWLEQAHKAQLTTKRRISPLGVGNDSIQRGNRRLRWASMFDAIRKNMRKREEAAAKQNHKKSNNDNSISSNNETGDIHGGVKRGPDKVPTPGELSKLKYERDKSIQEAYMNQEATRSRMMAAVAQQQKHQQQHQQQQQQHRQAKNASPKNTPKLDALLSSGPAHGGLQLNASLSHNSLPNDSLGSADLSQINYNNQLLTQLQQSSQQFAGKRPTTPNGTPYTGEQIQQILQNQKRRRLLQQQNQLNVTMGNNNSPNVVKTNNVMASKGLPANSAMPNMNPQVGQLGTSQRPQQLQQTPGPMNTQTAKSRIHFAPAQVSAIINSIQSKNPNLTKEQVTKLAASYLANLQQQLQNRANMVGTQRQTSSMNMPPQHLAMQHPRPSPNKPASGLQKQLNIATLTPQEKNQLQMLKAGKVAQQQHQLEQRQQQQLQQRSAPGMVGSPMFSPNGISQAEYEKRKNLMIQKQQEQRIQNLPGSPSGSVPLSPAVSSASSPTIEGKKRPSSSNSFNSGK